MQSQLEPACKTHWTHVPKYLKIEILCHTAMPKRHVYWKPFSLVSAATVHQDLPNLLLFSLSVVSNSFVTPVAKVGSQDIAGIIGKLGLGEQKEAGQRLTEFCQENALVIANTLFQQHKRWLYTWTSPNGQHWNQTDYILCSRRWRNCIQLEKKKRPGADCGS